MAFDAVGFWTVAGGVASVATVILGLYASRKPKKGESKSEESYEFFVGWRRRKSD